MTNSHPKNNVIIGISIMAAIMAFGIYYSIYSVDELQKNGIYTIGKIINFEGTKGGVNTVFVFSYKNKDYKLATMTRSFNVIKQEELGSSVLIKFLPYSPDKIIDVYKNCTGDTIFPTDGWQSPPCKLEEYSKNE